MHLIRIEYSGIKLLDIINKNINTNKFNALLSILIIFAVIKSLPPLLSWFILDANFAGDSKDACTGSGACWDYIKTWFNRFMYGMYPNAEQWRINLSFIALAFLGGVGFFASEKFKISNFVLCCCLSSNCFFIYILFYFRWPNFF